MNAPHAHVDAIDLMQQDHRAIEAAFARFDIADECDKPDLARGVCEALEIHAYIEEKLFYPALGGRIGDELLAAIENEHVPIDELVATIEALCASGGPLDAHMIALRARVDEHVAEEEREIMPQARDSGADLETVGASIAQFKRRLESGIAELEGREARP